MLGDAPWESLQPTLIKLLDDTEQNKQRAAAEILAGVLGGVPLFLFSYLALTYIGKLHQVPKIGHSLCGRYHGTGYRRSCPRFLAKMSSQILSQFGLRSWRCVLSVDVSSLVL